MIVVNTASLLQQHIKIFLESFLLNSSIRYRKDAGEGFLIEVYFGDKISNCNPG